MHMIIWDDIKRTCIKLLFVHRADLILRKNKKKRILKNTEISEKENFTHLKFKVSNFEQNNKEIKKIFFDDF